VLVRAPVERILVDEGRATGVALRNGSTIFARRGVVCSWCQSYLCILVPYGKKTGGGQI